MKINQSGIINSSGNRSIRPDYCGHELTRKHVCGIQASVMDPLGNGDLSMIEFFLPPDVSGLYI